MAFNNTTYGKILKKGKNAGNQHFLLFFRMFTTSPKANFTFRTTFILSSANAIYLDQSKIFSFGKELRLLPL